jgi:hypothetical protein
MSRTSAFRIHLICLPPGVRVKVSQWVRDNFDRRGFPGQVASNAETSCRCAQQRLAKQGWLTSSHVRTNKPAPDFGIE